jgi:hypothetical protein
MNQQHRNRVFHDFRQGLCRNLVCSGNNDLIIYWIICKVNLYLYKVTLYWIIRNSYKWKQTDWWVWSKTLDAMGGKILIASRTSDGKQLLLHKESLWYENCFLFFFYKWQSQGLIGQCNVKRILTTMKMIREVLMIST